MLKFYSIDECYQILGLESKKNYSLEEIKRAYREKALLHHPDKNKDDPQSSEIFLRIKEAYDIILNPSYAYKKLKSYKSNELDLVLNLEVSFSEGFFGKEFEFNFNTSNYLITKDKINFEIDYVNFKLPSGSSNIFTQIIPKKGFRKNNEYGDLIVRVTINPHKSFTLQGHDVVSNVSIPLSFFLKGGKIEVPTMYGLREIKIKPGTIPGSLHRIPNCGVNNSNYHIVVLNVVFPTEKELKEEEWSKLDINWSI